MPNVLRNSMHKSRENGRKKREVRAAMEAQVPMQRVNMRRICKSGLFFSLQSSQLYNRNKYSN